MNYWWGSGCCLSRASRDGAHLCGYIHIYAFYCSFIHIIGQQ